MGATWTDPLPVNSNADDDTGGDSLPTVVPYGSFRWVAAWFSNESEVGGGIGTDYDILYAYATSPDADGDSVADSLDNCPDMANENQADADGDGVGDACDVCPDTPPSQSVGPDGRPQGDFDGDCDVDLMDYAVFQQNFGGP